MTEFAYLSVLLSIILGLAVTQILQGWRARMIYHARVRGYWLTELWSVITLMICTQMWWAMFGLRDRHDWTFGQFTILLGQTIFIYLSAALLYPDFWAHETVDLRTHYFTQAKYMFGSMCAVIILSLWRHFAIEGAMHHGADLAFHLFFLVTAISGAFVVREWFHKLVSILVGGSFLAYVVFLFARLH